MPRRRVLFVPECYFHIYNRGNNRGAIFFEPANYIFFLKGIKQYLLPAADLIVYCLMPTHYHMLMRVKPSSEPSEGSGLSDGAHSPVSVAMMRLSVSYTMAINKRFGRVGSLFQGAFQARAITDSQYLFQICCYIHANPVKDGLVSDPANWPYSNYLEWIGERQGTLLDRSFVETQFSEPGDYKAFVAAYLRERLMPETVAQSLEGLEY